MLTTDYDLKSSEIQQISNANALAGMFAALGYDVDTRLTQTPEAMGFPESLAREVKRIERIADHEQGALQVYLVEMKHVTVKLTQDLARVFKSRAGLFLLVLTTTDYEQLDFVLLEQVLPTGNQSGIGTSQASLRPRILSVDRRNPDRVSLRVLRRFSYTELDTDYQWDKLRSAYGVAEWSEPLFNNRALFSDYYLNERLNQRSEWKEDARPAYRALSDLMAEARQKYSAQPEEKVRANLLEPVFKILGWTWEYGKQANSERKEPDYWLKTAASDRVPCLAYSWDRSLDSIDEKRDTNTPMENPAQSVVSILEEMDAESAGWAVVTNGKTWRLYSARAHSRATNYYEIDLEETLASPDLAETFRYFWLFFRANAFKKDGQGSFVDSLLTESASYAKALGDRLKENIFEDVFPYFAEGFIKNWGKPAVQLTDADLDETFHATLTFLYRLLFLLYAESRDLLPVKETRGYWEASLNRIKEEIAAKAGEIVDLADDKLEKAYSATETNFYDRLSELFAVIDKGKADLNVPMYNGGLFVTFDDEKSLKVSETFRDSDVEEAEEVRAARFLSTHKIPDRFLALGLDRLARNIDEKTQSLAMIDYKSLGVRQLGSIYEGLLEFKVRVAREKMAIVAGKKGEEIVAYKEAAEKKLKIKSTGRGAARSEFVIQKGAVYLENDKHERKASGSYYTPDYIVKYIVQQTVGPALEAKCEALRPRLRKAQEAHKRAVENQKAFQKMGQMGDDPEKQANDFAHVVDDLFDMRVLDPAMGSGHFLVEAVDFITDRLLAFLNAFPWNPVTATLRKTRQTILEEMQRQGVSIDPARLTDVNLLKRHVLKRCIYGVDLNPMAVELAKVSLWLDCFTLGAPLSFLDHHLKCGNSLIGAQVETVRSEIEMVTTTRTRKVAAENKKEYKTIQSIGMQFDMFGSMWTGAMLATDLMRNVGGLSDVTAEQVRQSRQEYKKAADALAPFKLILDVYTSRWFGNEDTKQSQPAMLFLRDGANMKWLKDPRTARADLKPDVAKIADTTLKASREKRFFHWELEFPEVFFGASKNSTQEIVLKENAGFDVVIGNPPYDVKVTSEDDVSEIDYFNSTYFGAAYKINVFSLFLERSISICKETGYNALIIPNTILANRHFEKLRRHIIEKKLLSQVAIPEGMPFGDAVVETVILVLYGSAYKDEIEIQTLLPDQIRTEYVLDVNTFGQLQRAEFRISWKPSDFSFLQKLNDVSVGLENLYDLYNGIKTQDNQSMLAKVAKSKTWKPVIRGGDVERYSIDWDNLYVNFDKKLLKSGFDESKHEQQQKVVIRRADNRMIAALESERYYILDTLHILSRLSDFDERALVAVLNSKVANHWLNLMQAESGIVLPEVKIDFLRSFPIRRIDFSGSQSHRKLYKEQLSTLISTRVFSDVTEFVDQRIVAREIDVIHDLLVLFAERMIELNQQKQAEMKRLLGWLEGVLKVSVDELTGKSKVRNYIGDYQKDEPELTFAELDDILFKNKNKVKVSLNDSRLMAKVRDEYEKSLEVLRPIKSALKWTDDLIDQVVYRLYGLTEEEIAIVEGKERPEPVKEIISTTPATTFEKPLSIARESDPNNLARIMSVLNRQGPLTARDLSGALTDMRVNLGPDKAETIRREFEFLKWIEPEQSKWTLTERGKDLASMAGAGHFSEFARQLCVDNDRYNQRVVSRLLQRMWQISPDLQGAIIIPKPAFENLPESLNELKKQLQVNLPKWSAALQKQVKNFGGIEHVNDFAENIVNGMSARWEKAPLSEKVNRLQTLIGEVFFQAMLGEIISPNDVDIWQNRMDWAGLTHTARDLPGTQGHIWYPVGAFREQGDEFTAVPGLVNAENQTFHRFTPSGKRFAEQFMSTLFDGYRQTQKVTNVEYVSLLAVRDWVCYRLRISHEVFEQTLQTQFPLALRKEIPYSLALEVDISHSELTRLGNARPVVIDGSPRYIISMRSRTK